MPTWGSVGAGTIPWTLGQPRDVVAVLFATELVAGGARPDGSTNKILWLTRAPVASNRIMLAARPVGAEVPVVTQEVPGTQGYEQGRQFPSIVDLPTPGCWRIDVSGGSLRSGFELNVLASGSLPRRP